MDEIDISISQHQGKDNWSLTGVIANYFGELLQITLDRMNRKVQDESTEYTMANGPSVVEAFRYLQ